MYVHSTVQFTNTGFRKNLFLLRKISKPRIPVRPVLFQSGLPEINVDIMARETCLC
jgi:hypothetical protein